MSNSIKKKVMKSKKFLGYKLDVDYHYKQYIAWKHQSWKDNKENSIEVNISLIRPQLGEYHLIFRKSIYTASNSYSKIEIHSKRCNSERKARRIVIEHLKLYSHK